MTKQTSPARRSRSPRSSGPATRRGPRTGPVEFERADTTGGSPPTASHDRPTPFDPTRNGGSDAEPGRPPGPGRDEPDEATTSLAYERAAAMPTAELEAELVLLGHRLARNTANLLVLVGEMDQRDAWATFGSLSCAGWLADLCDLDIGTARSHVRVARAMRRHPELGTAVVEGALTYTKARALVPYLNRENAGELVDLARRHSSRSLGAAIAAWSRRYEDDADRDERHHRERRLTWHTDGDGMVVMSVRLPPVEAAMMIAAIDRTVMTGAASADHGCSEAESDSEPESEAGPQSEARPQSESGLDASRDASAPGPESRRRPRQPRNASRGAFARPSLGQQRADALLHLTTTGWQDASEVASELVIHVRGDINTLADGTPVPDHAVARLLPRSFISLLVTDMKRRPIDASPRRRTPTRRQKRVVDERHPTCSEPGCDARAFLQYDHIRPHAQGGPTTIDNLQRLCGPHNRAKNPGRRTDGATRAR